MLKRLLRWIQPIFLGLALLFIVGLIASQWNELTAYPWRLHWGWLALSAFFMLLSWSIEIGLWRRILHLISISQDANLRVVFKPGFVSEPTAEDLPEVGPTPHLPFLVAARLWFLSAIVRYIPGNIWQPLSLTLYCRQWGFAPEATVTSVMLYQVVLLLSSIPLAVGYVGVTGNVGLLSTYVAQATAWLIGVGLLPLLIFLWQPAWLFRCLNWGLRKVGRAELTRSIDRIQLLQLILIAMLHWIAWGICFSALTFALSAYSINEMLALGPHLITVYAIAYTIGYLSVITPSGIGIREGAFFVLLAPLMGATAITVAALVMRLWTTIGELFAAAVSAGFDFYHRRTESQKNSAEAAVPPGNQATLREGVDR